MISKSEDFEMFEYMVYITLYMYVSFRLIVFFFVFLLSLRKRRGMNELKLHWQKPMSVFSCGKNARSNADAL